MRLKLMTSLIAATAIFTSISPALAQSKSTINPAYCNDNMAQDNNYNNISTGSHSQNFTQQTPRNLIGANVNAGLYYLNIDANLAGIQKKIKVGNVPTNSVNILQNTLNGDSPINGDNPAVTNSNSSQNCSNSVDAG
ncbi:hypothetical protein Riv7116_2961 [Rivularia sp. PCC 7116]|uniref:hypothetical protein n=1 Tax=Rivularia sp. PCC 7116 TaxID=373994 RepID=UPI00029F2447|nr:hypothetical protein [Rivularia sp. PCC 7116]AFY55442.1 hypothetical protein Riv7116_2961 [Rivularia sp. PCC 7116]